MFQIFQKYFLWEGEADQEQYFITYWNRVIYVETLYLNYRIIARTLSGFNNDWL